MQKPLITIFTPTYNRKELLVRCYESLKRQTNKNFVWIVVDDGSEDNTQELVEQWIEKENQFVIQYYYKNNGGLHTAYNLAIEKIETELSVCIDSDDYMPEDAIEKIINFWEKHGSNKYAGVTGLDFDAKTNTCIGGSYPEHIKSINLIDVLIGKYPEVYGDKKHIVRTELYKSVAPLESIENEKNFNPHYMHLEISKEYDFLILNENLCYVDYQDTGMTNNILRQYYNSPNSFAEIRLLYLSFYHLPLKFKIRNCIHYNSSCIIAKRKKYIRKCPFRIITILTFPLGFLLSIYIKLKNKKR